MRDIKNWHKKLVRKLEKACEGQGISASTLCEDELGLTLIMEVAPALEASGLWALLSGYPFPASEQYGWHEEQYRMVSIARHLLPFYLNPYPWRQAIARYKQVDERLRGYDILDNGCVMRRSVTLGAERFDVYRDVLHREPKFALRQLEWAGPGEYTFPANKRLSSVAIPEALVFPPPSRKHGITARNANPPICVSWNDLLQTARWMDQQCTGEPMGWEGRLSGRVNLEVFDGDHTALKPTDKLTVQGMLHLIGMVGSGKSTLMEVLAVWAAQHNYQVTLIVSDVINVLDRADMFVRLGITAAPILGSSNRKLHTNRLHQVLQAKRSGHPFLHTHKGFDWLSTACALDGLRDEARPLPLEDYPCNALYPKGRDENEDTDVQRRACPVYSLCPFHQAQRDLIDASIWIATPASLIYTAPSPQISREQMRFLELIYRHSDLVIVDEADLVQVQLDNVFSPSEILVNRGRDAWLNRLGEQTSLRLSLEGRGQLVDLQASAWSKAHDIVQNSANRVYTLLLQQKELAQRVDRNYFTEWMFFNELAHTLTASGTEDTPESMALMKVFSRFMRDPLGEKDYRAVGKHQGLIEIARLLLTRNNDVLNRQQIWNWIERHTGYIPEQDPERGLTVLLMEFAILVTVLSNRLQIILRDWKHAEQAFQLDGGGSGLFQNPPDDYAPIIPVSPMGNLLAYQYLRASGNPDEAGELRFFRCMGVGRWLLLHLNELYAGEGIIGPHVILLSGTSWAGTSPIYHIQVPVTGILRASQTEVEAIAEHSRFEFKPLHNADNQPITVSGKFGEARYNALTEMAYALTVQKKGIAGSLKSLLERTRAELPEGRQRMMLLVGSYQEAEFVRERIEQMRPDWRGQILNLVPDDEMAPGWKDIGATIRRGMVSEFAKLDAWLLIAPLLAVERGHNILNDQDKAAIGAVYFLVRPHPRPDDISYAIHAINRWAVDSYPSSAFNVDPETSNYASLNQAANLLRKSAYGYWRELLRLPLRYSTLRPVAQQAVTWSQLVTVWQVIGRLVRGGSPARVFFCDASFLRMTAGDDPKPIGSLLVEMRRVLKPYFDIDTVVDEQDKVLVQVLYGPFYEALKNMRGVPENV